MTEYSTHCNKFFPVLKQYFSNDYSNKIVFFQPTNKLENSGIWLFKRSIIV